MPWSERRLTGFYLRAIIEEVRTDELSLQFPAINGRPFLVLLSRHGERVQPDPVVGLVCRDPGDVTFVECLSGSGADGLITGGKELPEMRVKAAITTPRRLCDRYL